MMLLSRGTGIVLTCKHSDLIYVVEIAIAFALEAGPQVRDQDLGALVKTHPAPLEDRLVPEAGEVLCEQVDERCGGVVRVVDAVGEARVELLVWKSCQYG